VHRDISPQNVFVTRTGRVCLLDFGVAKAQNRSWETRNGTLKGKLTYMAPEQIRHDRVDERADLYAAGVLLYELVCGRKPYQAAPGDFGIMLAVAQHKIISPSVAAPNLPKVVCELLDKALAALPEHRFQTAMQFREAIFDAAALTGGLAPNARLARINKVAAQLTATPEDEDATDASIAKIENDELLSVEVFGDATLATLGHRISEAFPGAALGKLLSGPVIFDATRLRRITSFGVREWLHGAGISRRHSHCIDASATRVSGLR
jgi:serine/threonine protein kinase